MACLWNISPVLCEYIVKTWETLVMCQTLCKSIPVNCLISPSWLSYGVDTPTDPISWIRKQKHREERQCGWHHREQVAASLQSTCSPLAASSLFGVAFALHSHCALNLNKSTSISLSFHWKVRMVISIVVSVSVPQLPHLQIGAKNWFCTFVSKDYRSYFIKGKHVKLCLIHSKYSMNVRYKLMRLLFLQ